MHLHPKLLRNRVVRAAIRPFVPIRGREDLVRLGTDYGGWWVPSSLLTETSIVYSVGVGGDASFDIDLINRFHCQVRAFDPTPFSIEYVESNSWPDQWSFYPLGLWTEAKTLNFAPVTGQTSGSASITRPGNTNASFSGACETLDALMSMCGDAHIDLLKMDIEGAEGPVLEKLLESALRPAILCVEFDQPEMPWHLVRRIKKIIAAGYEANRVELWNYTFTRLR